MPDFVLPLDDPVATEPSVSGGKAATLARLRQRGLPVPEGAVVTTEVYRLLVDDSTVRSRLEDLTAAAEDDLDARNAAAAALRDAIRERSLPTDVTAELADSLPDGPYAVRSSATAEDLPGASFAGQYDTHLGVAREDVADAVLDCMASLFTDRAVAYRARNDLPQADARMAVLVQRMVEPDAAGVLFTADPLTGSRSVSVVDAGPGRGDAQVSGRTTADSVRYDERSDTITEYSPGSGRDRPVLSEVDVRALVAVGDRVADVLGAPQDVEWAVRDGEIFVLQARPITTLFPLPAARPTDDAPRVYYSFGHRQGMPDAMPPLVLDVWTDLIDVVYGSLGAEQSLVTTAGGRVYVDLTPFLTRPLVRDALLASYDEIDPPAARALRAWLADQPSDWPETGSVATDAFGVLRAVRRVWPRVGGVLGAVPAALLRNDPTEDPERLREVYDRSVAHAREAIDARETPVDRWTTAYEELLDAPDWLLDPFYPPFLAALLAGGALRRLADDPARVDALALGIDHDAVYRMTMAVGDLADVARDHSAVADAIRDGATRADLAARDDADAFLAELDAFLEEYGFRAAGEIDVSRPRYREDPSLVLGTVAARLRSADAGAHRTRHDRLRGRAADAERALVRNTTPVLRPFVRRLARVYRNGVGLREHPKFALSRLLDALRDETLAAGRALVDAGALPDADAVWLLSVEELRAGLADPRTLAGVDVAGRRREYERHRRLDAPLLLTSDGEALRATVDTSPTGVRRGVAAAPGVVEGRVRVVTDPASDRLEPGEVLVAPYTDPGWTPLFLNAAAVVTEVGGRLTHGALVAREYGIPAVVAVPDATDYLRTGDRVRVDGNTGVVERLD